MTLILPFTREKRVVTNWQHIQDGDLQSEQNPLTWQGVAVFKRAAFNGAATFLARS